MRTLPTEWDRDTLVDSFAQIEWESEIDSMDSLMLIRPGRFHFNAWRGRRAIVLKGSVRNAEQTPHRYQRRVS